MKRSSEISLSPGFTNKIDQRGRTLTGTFVAISLAMTLAGCGEEPADTTAYAYKDVKACIAAGVFTAKTCEDFGNKAIKDHLATAPRYEKKSDCEGDYGVGQCNSGSGNTNNGGGGFFMPYMMGYMMGSSSNGGGNYSTPVYRSNGGYVTANGNGIASNAFAKTATGFKTYSGHFTTPPAAGFQSHSSVVSRGGFGSRGASMSASHGSSMGG